MIIPTDSSKYLYSWRYVEIAKYVPSLDRVIRIKDNNVSRMLDVDDVESFRKEHDNFGLYTSVWNYNSKDIDNSTRFGPLYFDIDNSDELLAFADASALYEYLISNIPKESVIVYFTGKKGFHIECEPITLGINPSNNLPNIYRYIATKIKEKLNLVSLDFSVYDLRRMWRLPRSIHQSTGLFKNSIPSEIFKLGLPAIKDYCKTEKSQEVIEPIFDFKSNEWFREFSYEMEIDKERSKDFISYFNKYGSSVFKSTEEKDKQFTVDRLLNNCKAINELVNQAKEKKWLDHESRLFLCSILTYTEDSVEFLHSILSNCEDYSFDKSSSHINDWIKRRQLGIGGRPYTCERANAAGVGCGDCELDHKKRWIKIGNRYVESDETVSPSPIRYAYVNVNKGGENVEYSRSR